MRPRLHSCIEYDVSTFYWPRAARPHGLTCDSTVYRGRRRQDPLIWQHLCHDPHAHRVHRRDDNTGDGIGARKAFYGYRHTSTSCTCTMTTTSMTRSLSNVRHQHRRRRDHHLHAHTTTPTTRASAASAPTAHGITARSRPRVHSGLRSRSRRACRLPATTRTPTSLPTPSTTPSTRARPEHPSDMWTHKEGR